MYRRRDPRSSTRLLEVTRRPFHMRPELPDNPDRLFEPPPWDFSATPWTVERISPNTLGLWAVRWHYSRNGGPTPKAYGAYAPSLAVVAGLAQSSSKDGLARRLRLTEFAGNLELSRVVAHPYAPRNAVSHALGQFMRTWRSEGIDWVFSYSDTGQNHHGGIYQAINAVYVGTTKSRTGFLLDGKLIHQRSVHRQFGGQGPDALERARQLGHTITRVPHAMTPKHTYVIPCGSPAVRRQIRKILSKNELPYPTRLQPPSHWLETP